jgi:hypothetical protein
MILNMRLGFFLFTAECAARTRVLDTRCPVLIRSHAQQHGRAGPQWRKLRIAVDADGGEIAAHVVLARHSVLQTVPPLARQRRRGSRGRSGRRPA